jgi:hypothetical protein
MVTNRTFNHHRDEVPLASKLNGLFWYAVKE